MLQIFLASGSRRNPRGEVYIYAAPEVGVSASAQSPRGQLPALQARRGRKKRSSPRKQTNAAPSACGTAPADQRPKPSRPAGQRLHTSHRDNRSSRPQPSAQRLRSSRPPRAGGKERAGSGRPGRISLNPTARSRRSRKIRIYARKNPFAHR